MIFSITFLTKQNKAAKCGLFLERKTMTALFKISEQHSQALTIIEQMFDDECPESELDEALGLLDNIESSFNDKAVNVAMYIRNQEAEADAIDEAVKAMTARSRSLKAKAGRMKQYLLDEMKVTQTTQIRCPFFSVSVRQNPPSVKVTMGAVLPDALLLPAKPRDPDKKAIKSLREDGVTVEGCTLERGESLVIK